MVILVTLVTQFTMVTLFTLVTLHNRSAVVIVSGSCKARSAKCQTQLDLLNKKKWRMYIQKTVKLSLFSMLSSVPAYMRRTSACVSA